MIDQLGQAITIPMPLTPASMLVLAARMANQLLALGVSSFLLNPIFEAGQVQSTMQNNCSCDLTPHNPVHIGGHEFGDNINVDLEDEPEPIKL